MSIELTIVLGVFILVIAAGVFYLLKRVEDQNDNQPYTPPAYSKEELDNIKLAEELYNKDLRPVIGEEPKGVVKLAKVFPDHASINLEQVKPVKKRKKYYPKAPKTNT
jgi:hypothetical protein